MLSNSKIEAFFILKVLIERSIRNFCSLTDFCNTGLEVSLVCKYCGRSIQNLDLLLVR